MARALREEQNTSLVVFSTGLSLRIQNTTPVISLEVRLVVNIDLDLNSLSLRLHRVGRHTSRLKEPTNELPEACRAPGFDLTGFEVELSSQDRITDGTVGADSAKRKGLVDGGALIAKCVDSAFRVNGNANGETARHPGGRRPR